MTAAAAVPRAALELCVATRDAGLTSTAAAVAASPDAVFGALVFGLTRSVVAPRLSPPNVWPCSAPGCRRLAMLSAVAFASPDRDALGAAALCDECDPTLRATKARDLAALRRVTRDASAQSERRAAQEDGALRAWVAAVGIETVAAEIGSTVDDVARVLGGAA